MHKDQIEILINSQAHLATNHKINYNLKIIIGLYTRNDKIFIQA